MTVLDHVALGVAIAGALNWGLIGVLQFDLIAALAGGADTIVARAAYALVGLAGLYCVSLPFRAAHWMRAGNVIS